VAICLFFALTLASAGAPLGSVRGSSSADWGSIPARAELRPFFSQKAQLSALLARTLLYFERQGMGRQSQKGKVMERDVSNLGRGTLNLLKAAMLVAIIGALNWGLIGFFNWNLVDAIFGGGAAETTSSASRVVYAIVGLAGLASVYLLSSLGVGERHHGVHSTPQPR
jgi:uncharacterized membrane protein YuzA (DUF378 family)